MYADKVIDREKALLANHTKFIHPCHIHGDASVHETATGNCDACAADNKDDHAVTRARNLRSIMYPGICPVHGPTDFHGQIFKCATCYTASKRLRTAPGRPIINSARANARRAGERQYAGPCDKHGISGHYVSTGKCASCFTAMGATRQWTRV